MTSPMPLEDTTWAEDAVATIIGLAHRNPIFSADDLRAEMRPAPHPNMVGAAFRAARTQGFITRAGDKTSATKSRNGSLIRTWTLKPTTERKTA